MWLDFHISVVSTGPEYETFPNLTPSDLILLLCYPHNREMWFLFLHYFTDEESEVQRCMSD